jgi:hypothetical protein
MLFEKILDGIREKVAAHNAYKKVVQGVFSEVCHINITDDMIVSLKEGVLILRLPPTLSMLAKLKKAALIQALRDRELSVVDIR